MKASSRSEKKKKEKNRLKQEVEMEFREEKEKYKKHIDALNGDLEYMQEQLMTEQREKENMISELAELRQFAEVGLGDERGREEDKADLT